MVEIESGRAVLQLITHDVARASRSVGLLAPPDAFPLLAPALRRPVSAGLPVSLWSTGPVDLGFVSVELVSGDHGWPGHWSTAPAFVAAARLALEQFGAPNG